MVKPVSSPVWCKEQINMIALSGNAKFRALLEEYQIQNFEIKDKYRTIASLYYRMRLQTIVNQDFKFIEAP